MSIVSGVVLASGGILLLAISVSPRTCFGATRLVGSQPPAEFTQIQAAINASSSGDTVLVAPGTYFENVSFLGKAIALISSEGPDATVIDGSGLDKATVTIVDVVGEGALLSEFTITGGRGYEEGPGSPRGGGGVAVISSSVMVIGNRIIGNSARTPHAPNTNGWGGGVVVAGAGDVSIIDNAISGNVAGLLGGGICIAGGVTRVVIQGNEVFENVVLFGDGGGACAHMSSGTVEFLENHIHNNSAGDHGGGLYLGSSNPNKNFPFVLERNIIRDNVATSRSPTPDAGGGAWIAGLNGPIRSNTFVGNLTVSGSPPDGSGLAIISDSQVTLEYNLFALNRPGAALACEPTVTTSIAHNLFWANLPSDVSGAPCSQQVLESNLFADPQFCDSLGGDLSLAASSPALTYPFGPIGAVTEPGCEGVLVVASTWSRIKALWGDPEALRRGALAAPAVPTSLPIITITP